MKYIETDRLILRNWTLNDVKDQVEGLGNFETAKNLTVPFPYREENSIEYISKHLKNNVNSYAFAVELKENGKVIGGTSLDLIDGVYGGGVWLNENFTGRGYGTEIWIARAKFAFEVLGVDKLENGYFEFNERSRHMHEKVGHKTISNSVKYCPALKRNVVEIWTRLIREDFYKALNLANLMEIYNKIKI